MNATTVLAAVPYDRWLTAGEIAGKTGLSSHRVACLIKEYLVSTKKVERKRIRGQNGASFHYRRILWL